MKQSPIPERFAQGSQGVLDRRQQRELDRARGLVPFAVKLPGELVRQLRETAQARKVDLNDLVAGLLKKSLDSK
jgi:predicted HicB family RNase H-like nuclease